MTLSHLAGRDGGACAGAGVEADMVGRGVGALNFQRKGVIDIRGEHALRAEMQRRRDAADHGRRHHRHLHGEARDQGGGVG